MPWRLAAYADWAEPGRVARELGELTGGSAPAAEVALDGAALAVAAGPAWSAPAASGAAARLGPAALVADARIDNLDDVRRALGAGPEATAAEVLVRGYLAWGDGLPDRLSGDFALVIWDERYRRLTAARDPFGVRPLAYRAAPGRIWVASQVDALLATFETRPALDDGMVVDYLLWRNSVGAATFFRDVRQVPPGHLVTATASGVEARRYFFPPRRLAGRGESREDHAREFRRLFIQAVERRLRGPAPALVHVSGGLDSSAVAGAADALVRAGSLPAGSVRGAAGVYPGLACDERPYIDAVARKVSFPIDVWDATLAETADLTEPARECPDGRFAQVGGTRGDVAIAQARGARVILSGNGGDQLATPIGVVQDLIAAGDIGGAARELWRFPGATARSRLGRARFVAVESLPPSVRRLARALRAGTPAWLVPEAARLAREGAGAPEPELRYASHIQRHCWERLTSQQILRSVQALQRHVAGTGEEFRFPFLDRDLVLFVLALPHGSWPHPRPFARLHREMLADLLPAEVAARFGKAEFTPALMNRVLRAQPIVQELLFSGEWASGRYVDRDRAQAFWKGVVGRRDDGAWLDWRQVWAMATLEAWLRAQLGYHGRNEH
jgi:asparagine synthase (glutamine-hydrolysing)